MIKVKIYHSISKEFASLSPYKNLAMLKFRYSLYNRLHIIVALVSLLCLVACGESTKNNSPSDLNFENINTTQEFSNLIIKAIKTNRTAIVISKFSESSSVDENSLSAMINAYSQAIAKKKWDYEAYSYGKEESKGYGYRWIDPYNRTAIIIEVNSSNSESGMVVNQLEFASRLDVLDSHSYPGGELTQDRLLLNSKLGTPIK